MYVNIQTNIVIAINDLELREHHHIIFRRILFIFLFFFVGGEVSRLGKW